MINQKRKNIFPIVFGGITSATVLGIGFFLLVSLLPSSIIVQTPTAYVIRLVYPTSISTPESSIELMTTKISDGNSFQIGSYVQITGTDGEGLRFRMDSSTSAEVLFIAMESEAFLVQQGPVEADGYLWYYLTAPYDNSRAGWAASNYFVLLATPEP